MACPDELTLDLWLADALPSDEAAAIATHVPTCPTCSAATAALAGVDAELHAALALDAEELTYLSGLGLASAWRTSSAAAASVWGWCALALVVAGFTAWQLAAPVLSTGVAVAALLGVGGVLVHAALGLVFSLGETLLDVIRSPALGLSQPLLALLALALLVWPRQLIPHRSTHA